MMDWIEARRILREWRLGNAEADIADSAERALAGRGPVRLCVRETAETRSGPIERNHFSAYRETAETRSDQESHTSQRIERRERLDF